VVTATLTNNSSCISNSTATSNAVAIKVEICVDDVYVPNTFTPNGDGKNDVLKVYGTYQQSTLSVYNQWGQLLFTGDGSIGWDGRHKGVLQPNGTYVYVADVLVTGQRSVTKKGNVNLIR
jgi:gliding motility-associated-like protein